MDSTKFKNRLSSRIHFEAFKMRLQAKPLAPFSTRKKKTPRHVTTGVYMFKSVWELPTVHCFPKLFEVVKQEPIKWSDFHSHLFVNVQRGFPSSRSKKIQYFERVTLLHSTFRLKSALLNKPLRIHLRCIATVDSCQIAS